MSITYETSNLATSGALALLGLVSLVSFIRPRRLILFYLAILLFFTGSLYGTAELLTGHVAASDVFTIYTRGTGQLGISLLNIYLILLFLLTGLLCPSGPTPPTAGSDPSLRFIGFLAFTFLMYTAYGLLADVTPANAFSQYGLFCFVNMAMFQLVLRRCLSSEEELQAFQRLFITCCFLMAVYGLARVPFGGDPANYYANYEQKRVALSFFDIGQGALFCISLIYLYHERQTLFPLGFKRGGMMLLCLGNIILSYRRTSWLGLGLVFLWILGTLPLQRKLLFLMLGGILLATVITVSESRFVDPKAKAASQSRSMADFTNAKGEIEIKSGRFAELYQAVMAASDSPVLGLGPWGLNREFTINHGQGPTSFVHSTVVHVFLKLGVVGLIPYLLLLVGFPLWWMRTSKLAWRSPELKRIAEAFFCGFVFWIPDLMFGTPLSIYRHSQLLAMIFAVPFIAWTLDQAPREEVPRAPR